jgi:hypothetical protein
MGWACGMSRRQHRCIQGLGRDTSCYLEDLGVDERIILNRILERSGMGHGLD